MIGTNKYRRPIIRNGVKVSFLLQENAITSSNIPLLRILDALRLVKEIPATSPDECVTNICKAIEVLSQEEKQELTELSLAYTGTNKYRRPIIRNGVKVSFLLQENAITSSNIPLLRILDALRLVKEIPATSPDECVTNICKAIEVLSQEEKQELTELSLAYTPYVRALLGAIYEKIGLDTQVISGTLNGVTSYKLPISDKVLSNKRNWNII